MSGNRSARGNPSQRGSHRGSGYQGNRGGYGNHGNRGGASNYGNRDASGNYEGPNNSRPSQSEAGNSSYGSEYGEFRGAQSRMNFRQNSASNINTAEYGNDYKTNTDYMENRGQSGDRGRGYYQNIGQDQRGGDHFHKRAVHDDYIERDGQNRGRGGNNYNRGRGKQRDYSDRQGHPEYHDGQRENSERGCNNDNRGMGGQSNNRGRGGQCRNRGKEEQGDNRVRSGYTDNYEGQGQNTERGYNTDNRGRGGQSGNRGRGGQSGNRGRGGQVEYRDRQGYSDNYEGQGQSSERGYNTGNRGRGVHSGNRGRGGQSGNGGRGEQGEYTDSPGYTDYSEGQGQSSERGYCTDNRGRGEQSGNRGRGGQSGNRGRRELNDYRDGQGYTDNYEGPGQRSERGYNTDSRGRGGHRGSRGTGGHSQNREMGSRQNLYNEGRSETTDSGRNREHIGEYNEGYYRNNDSQKDTRGCSGNRGTDRGNRGGHHGATNRERNFTTQNRQNQDDNYPRQDFANVGPGFMYPPPIPPPPLFPPAYPNLPPPGVGPAPSNLYNHPQFSSTWSLNNTGVRPGNLSRSTSTPSVNDIGARPKRKAFIDRPDHREEPQQQDYGSDRGENVSGRQIKPGNRFRRGRGRGRNQYRNKKVDCQTDFEKNEEDHDETGDYEESNQRQNHNKSKSRKERSRGKRNRVSWNTINQIVSSGYKEVENRERGSSFGSFGSTLSLTSEVSEINETEKQQDNELKLDDLGIAKLQTLRNRAKRYKLRLQNLHKEDNTDKDKIEEFEHGISLLRNAITERSKSETQTDTEHVANMDVDVEEEEFENKPCMKEDKTIKLPRKINLALPKRGKISFKPKPKLLITKRTKTNLILTENVESSFESSDEEPEEDINKGNQEMIDKAKELPKEKTKIKMTKKKKQGKKTKVDNTNTGRIIDDNLDDLMSKLDDLCKPNKADDQKLKKNVQKKPSSATAGKQTDEANKKEGIYFAFKPSENETLGEKKRPNTYSEKSEKVSSTNKTGSFTENGPNVNDVFKFLVKHLGGVAAPDVIASESGLFPDGFDIEKWFIGYRKRFTIIERQGRITNVLVYNKDVTYCLDYITKRSCDKPDCNRYHVCKDMLCGNCTFGDEQCKFSHDFLDENNKNLSISKRFGYNTVFTNEEIRYILMARYPHICMSWNENGQCEKLNCTSLHICQRFILGHCLEDKAACLFSHDKLSEHNKPIMDGYRMGQWNDNIFRRMIFIMRSPKVSGLTEGATGRERTVSMEEEEEESNKIEDRETIHDCLNIDVTEPMLPVQGKTKKQTTQQEVKKSKFVSSAADEIGFVCENSIKPNGCSQHRCRLAHLEERMPYIWQLKIFGQWISFHHVEDVERAYCGKMDGYSTELERDASIYKIYVVFKPNPHAIVSMDAQTDGQDILEVRRLSTRSYMEGAYKSESYKTQWRWYFRNDSGQWELFEPNMQLTLEQKFLAGQKIYLYPRENFKFRYECDFETMTQVNLVTRKTREVLRRPIFVSRQHVDSGSFPETLKAPPSLPPVPKGWFPWDICNQFEFIKLSSESGDYRDVEESFFLTVNRQRYSIDEILRVQNPVLWRAYCTEEESMQANLERAGREDAVVYKRNLFHGTKDLDVVRGIAVNNFDFRLSGKNGTVYGEGAYFARDAKYSSSYTDSTGGEKFMFRATVLVGEYTLAKKEYKRPPNKPGKSHELFDSCVDRMDNPAIFVLFDRAKYYPEYLIVYHDNQAPLELPRPRRVTPPSINRNVHSSASYTSQGPSQTNTSAGISHPSSAQSYISSYPYISQASFSTPRASQAYPSSPFTYPSSGPAGSSNQARNNNEERSPPVSSPKKPDSCSIQ